ncbi:hypothetical protein ACFOZ7_09580 [Natribaculum luteum]|uniref:Uncharacterized protein n=1 Tax=Natribaculum luteum TaxID=1586232 RepID=A0ABD5NZ12_9EURY|nr:hypothetical protein [Natribaculum luteum]
MKRLSIFATVVAVTLAMSMGAIATQPVAAQAQENSSDEVYPGDQGPVSPDVQENATDEPTVAPSEDYLQQIDNETRIVDWEYRPGMFTIEIEADSATQISMTEAGDFEEGTGTFNYKETGLQEGTNTVTMPVTDREGAGVAIATRASLEQGSGAFVSVGQVEKNPFRHFGGESGLFTGVIMTIVSAALGAAYVIRSEDNGVIEA